MRSFNAVQDKWCVHRSAPPHSGSVRSEGKMEEEAIFKILDRYGRRIHRRVGMKNCVSASRSHCAVVGYDDTRLQGSGSGSMSDLSQACTWRLGPVHLKVTFNGVSCEFADHSLQGALLGSSQKLSRDKRLLSSCLYAGRAARHMAPFVSPQTAADFCQQ